MDGTYQSDTNLQGQTHLTVVSKLATPYVNQEFTYNQYSRFAFPLNQL